MPTDHDTNDARESVDSRYALHYELLGDRAGLSGAMKASLVARFGHFGLLFGLFFAAVIAPSTLAGVSLIDYKALFTADSLETFAFVGPGEILLGLLVLVDYAGRLLVRGQRYPLFRQLRDGTDTVADWRDHLAQSASRLPRVFILELLTLVATVVGLALLIVPGLYVLFVAGPIFHFAIGRDLPFGEAIKRGRAFAHRHRGRLIRRLLVRIGWRIFLVGLVVGGFFLLGRYAAMYIPLAALLTGVLFVALRPFVLHIGMMKEIAYLTTLEQLDGDLELADD